MGKALRALVGFAVLALTPLAQSAPGLQINAAGKLTGASGIYVNGAFYDVIFRDGTCFALFNGCNEPSDFTFADTTAALAAADALQSQVFLDSAAGAFDSQPFLTNGCESPTACTTDIPRDALNESVQSAFFFNVDRDTDIVDMDRIGLLGRSIFFDSTLIPSETYAIFTPSPIPEAPTFLLTAVALGILGVRAKRMRRSVVIA